MPPAIDAILQDNISSIRRNILYIVKETRKPVVDPIIGILRLFQFMQNMLIAVYSIKSILKQSIRVLENDENGQTSQTPIDGL
jgi:hypothetical protein